MTFSRNRISVMAKWNYVGLRKRGALPALGADGYEYWKAQTRLDASIGYQLTPRLRINASLSNVLNEPQILLRYGSQTPQNARQYRRGEYGAAITLGIKGTF